MDLTFAFAVEEKDKLQKGDHFGNAKYYSIYRMSPKEESFLGQRKNGNVEEDDDEDIHGDAGKAKSIASILEDADVLVARQFGPNIKRMIKKFVCVIARVDSVEEAKVLIKDNWGKIEQEYKNGQERKPLVLAGS